MRRQCDCWCAVCGGQYDWREGDGALTIQASCRPEDTWVFKAHVPPPGACDNMMVALKRAANLQKKNFMEVVDEGIKGSSWRKVVAALRQ